MSTNWGGSCEGSGRKATIDGAEERKRHGSIKNHFGNKTADKPNASTTSKAKESITSDKLLQKSAHEPVRKSSKSLATIFAKKIVHKSNNTLKKDHDDDINNKLGEQQELFTSKDMETDT